MKKAIITGATGLIGSCVTKHLVSQGIDVLCLGRTPLEDEAITKTFGIKLKYIALEMKNILNLEEKANEIGWTSNEDCVFFHFAWGGKKTLTDGSFSDQINNAVYAANSVKIAKKMGCRKFINVGTLEETFIEHSLNSHTTYISSQTDYSLAKLAARDLCKMTAYLEKIDYIHTRLSAPISIDLSRGGYIAATIKAIKEGKIFEKPKSKRLFDIISISDVARAYFLIGKCGKNKSDYFIGTSKPLTLREFFENIKLAVEGRPFNQQRDHVSNEVVFNTLSLTIDTGFSVATDMPESLFK